MKKYSQKLLTNRLAETKILVENMKKSSYLGFKSL